MPCSQCGTTLLPGKKFCHACGARTQASCASCGEALDPGFRFCPECGAPSDGSSPLVEPTPVEVLAPADPLLRHIPESLAAKIRRAGAVAGERKRATVLFCDLVGSTAIAEGLDPEEYRELLDGFLEIAFAEIYRYEGIVNQLAGDGFMALFGAPIAHEDSPERAVRAALGIQDALDGMVSERGIDLTARIGVHTGTVVVGTMGNDLKTDYTAIGDTTNLAARLQALAAPGSVLVSESTHALVRDRFRTQPEGPFDVKGKSDPITAYEVLELADTTPMAIAEARGLTPLVGRDPELAQLEACFHRLEENLAQVVSIVGEAGSGKSRLIYEFKQRLAREDALVLEGHCASLTRGVPYAPWNLMMKRFFGLGSNEDPAAAWRRVTAQVAEVCGPDHEMLIPYLGEMISLPCPDGQVPPEMDKQHHFHAVAKLIGKTAMQRPVVMILEDLHWIDDASLEMLERAIAVSNNEKMMVVVTHRPEFRPSWQSQAAFTQLHLRPLGEESARRVVRARAGGALPSALEDRLLRRADGNPFYLEELTRALIEEGALVAEGGQVSVTRPVEEIRIPDSVQEVLGARLDRLRPESKRVAQIASVFGRQFKGAQLEALLANEGNGHDIDVAIELAELEQRGVVHRNGLDSDEFRFGESLTQEVAYEGLLLRERRQLHQQVGQMLEESAPETGRDRGSLALIGYHYARSDEREKGILKLLEAADQAVEMPFYGDALRLYRKAADLAESLLAEGNTGQELRRSTLRAIRGTLSVYMVYGETRAEEAERTAHRGLELAAELGDAEGIAGLSSLLGTVVLNSTRERFGEGIGILEEALERTRSAGLERSVAAITRTLSWAYMGDGRFDDARRYIGQTLSELERLGDREQVSDSYLGARFFQNRLLYESDDFETALREIQETYELCKSKGNRTIETASTSQLAILHFRRGEYDEAERYAQLGVDVAEEIENASAIRSCNIVLEGVRYIRDPHDVDSAALDGLERSLMSGGDISMNHDLIVEVLLGLGEIERARKLADLGARRAGGRLREARSAISLGQVARDRGPEYAGKAQHYFERALQLSREVGARSLVARSQLGLAQLARADDPSEEPALAREALDTFRKLGLGYYTEQAERLLGSG